MEETPIDQGSDGSLRRLWTPWRMQYVGGGTKEAGCVFCNRLAADDDVRGLILHRGRHAFAIMNLFPYNTGHVMLVPNEHVASPEDASSEALAEIAELLPFTLRAARRALACHGFNVGLNVGSVAGAGIAEHMHQHVVPRWNGDANFMPIIGSTMVMPELIPVTYAKLRAELRRIEGAEVPLVILDSSGERILVEGGRLPRVTPGPDQSVAAAALDHARTLGTPASIVGWAGNRIAGSGGPIGLTLQAIDAIADSERWSPLADAAELLEPAARLVVSNATRNLAAPHQS